MSPNRVAGKSSKEIERSTLDRASELRERAEIELSKLLAESDRREAETKAKNTRFLEEARRMRALMEALSNAGMYPVIASDEATIAEWASMWLGVAQQLKLNECEHLVDQVEAPDDPDYELARSLMRRALAGDSQQQLTRSLVDMFRKPEGGYRCLKLDCFFLLLRDAVQEHWCPAVRTEPAVESAAFSASFSPEAVVRHRLPDEKQAARVLKVWRRIQLEPEPMVPAAKLRELGLSPHTVFAESQRWRFGIDYDGTGGRNRRYARSTLSTYALFSWSPRRGRSNEK
ncbi:MAG: hypothetical protein HUU28_10545 [Planctomycetaceae bacterium]|nr:hypothetical protein [Planctomycetaceae bacterium]